MLGKGKWLIAHLVNMTYEYQRPVEKVLPVNVKLKIKTPGKTVGEAFLLTTKEKVDVMGTVGEAKLNISNLAEYEAVVMRLS